MDARIRPLRPEDFRDAGRIFFCAVHEGTRHAYTAAERRAWAGDTIDLASWEARLKGLPGFVAEAVGEPVGFMTIDATGYVDLAFVLPSAAGRGIGAALLAAVEDWARAQGVAEMHTAASLAARPFFAAHGWHVAAAEEVQRQGVALRRFQMRKRLSTDSP
jgi:putative acetyltransferase